MVKLEQCKKGATDYQRVPSNPSIHPAGFRYLRSIWPVDYTV